MANPFDLSHVFMFKLRLISLDAWQKIQDDLIPKRKTEESLATDNDIEVSNAEGDTDILAADAANEKQVNKS